MEFVSIQPATTVHPSTRKCLAVTETRRGVMLVFVCVLLFVFLAMAAMSVDIAYMHLVRSELRAATDAAATAAAETLSRTQDSQAAIQAGKELALANKVAGAGLQLRDQDFVLGNASFSAQTGKYAFTPEGTPVNSIRVNAQKTQGSASGPASLLFGRLLGVPFFQPQQTATATFLDRDIVLVLDRSGSMLGQRMTDLKAAVHTFVQVLSSNNSTEHVGLASYSTGATEDVDLVTNLALITQFSDQMIAAGRTSISGGMSAGLNIMQRGFNRPYVERTMIVMTDGHHNQGIEPRIVAQQVAALKITIHSVTFGSNPDSVRMSEVAAIGNGLYFHAETGAQLDSVFREIAMSLSTILIE